MNSFYGRTVIDRLADTEWFYEGYDVRAVTDGTTDKAVDVLNAHGIPAIAVSDASAPTEAIKSIVDGVLTYLVTYGWSHKVPPDAIELPEQAAINCYLSYRPDYKDQVVHRVEWAHAEEFGGVSVHYLTDEFDKGEIITQARFRIEFCDTPWDIVYKYSDLFAVLLRETLLLLDYEDNDPSPNEGVRYYSKVDVPWSKRIKHGIVNHAFRESIATYGRKSSLCMPDTDITRDSDRRVASSQE